jgi:hypothetical protein
VDTWLRHLQPICRVPVVSLEPYALVLVKIIP